MRNVYFQIVTACVTEYPVLSMCICITAKRRNMSSNMTGNKHAYIGNPKSSPILYFNPEIQIYNTCTNVHPGRTSDFLQGTWIASSN